MAKERAGATEVIDYEEAPVMETLDELTAGRGPDACIDAVGATAYGSCPAWSDIMGVGETGPRMALARLLRCRAVR